MAGTEATIRPARRRPCEQTRRSADVTNVTCFMGVLGYDAGLLLQNQGLALKRSVGGQARRELNRSETRHKLTRALIIVQNQIFIRHCTIVRRQFLCPCLQIPADTTSGPEEIHEEERRNKFRPEISFRSKSTSSTRVVLIIAQNRNQTRLTRRSCKSSGARSRPGSGSRHADKRQPYRFGDVLGVSRPNPNPDQLCRVARVRKRKILRSRTGQ